MHQAESSSSLFSLWTGLSLPAALHPVSRRRSCLQLRTDQCFCPMRTFTSLLVRTLRRTPRPLSALLLLRPLSVVPLLHFPLSPKIFYNIFFRSRANFKIIQPKVLLRPLTLPLSVSEKL